MADERIVTDETALPPPGAHQDRGAGQFKRAGTFTGSRPKMMMPLMLAGFLGLIAMAASGIGTSEKSQLDEFQEDERLSREAAGIRVDPEKAALGGLGAGQSRGQAASSSPGPASEADFGPEQQPGPGQTVPPIGAEPNGSMAVARPSGPTPAQVAASERAERAAAARRAPVMVLVGNSTPAASSSSPIQRSRSPATLRDTNELESRLQPTQLTLTRAGVIPNRNFLITAGTQIPCVLQTALDSSQPGFTSCIVTRNIFSDNGKVILFDKGTKILGEYQGGLTQGQDRLFVLWNRAITPRGVIIELGSPAADALGRAGMSGQVETFFWRRFGAGLLLSMVGDASAAIANRVADARETSRAPNAAASTAVENDSRIRPVLRARQGAEMTVFAARDFDFSGVYSLRLKR